MKRLVMHMHKIRNLTAIALAMSSVGMTGMVAAETSNKTCTGTSTNCLHKHKVHTTHAQHHESKINTNSKSKHKHYSNLKGEKTFHRSYKGERSYKNERSYKDEYMTTSKKSYKSIANNLSYRSFTNQVQVTPADPSWYATVGAVDYSVNLPTYRLPITFGRWLPTKPPTLPPSDRGTGFNSATSKARNTTILPFLAIGYNLKNGSRFFPKYFDHETIEFNYGQFNRATKVTTNYVGATGVNAGAGYGVIWVINDPSAPLYNTGALRIVNSYIHASAHYHEADLYMKADIKNLPSYLTSSAKIGLVATALDQFYSYNINATSQGIARYSIKTTGDDSLRARYVGIGIGDTLDFRFASAFSWFISADVQGLYAMTTMVSNQIPDQDAEPNGYFSANRNNIRVTDYATKATYRAHATTGINFYPNLLKKTHPIKISVFGGVDQWGYVPQEMTLTSFNSSESHLGQASMRNYFVGASFSMAIA